MKTHELKSWPEYFQAVLDGIKTFEARKNDRGFEVGDHLRLHEWQPEGASLFAGQYTGRGITVEVTYILNGYESSTKFGVQEGFCVMAIKPV